MADRYFIHVEYGTFTPFQAFLLERDEAGDFRPARFYSYNPLKEGRIRTDAEHYAALEDFASDIPACGVSVSPPVPSFIATIERHGRFRVFGSADEAFGQEGWVQ